MMHTHVSIYATYMLYIINIYNYVYRKDLTSRDNTRTKRSPLDGILFISGFGLISDDDILTTDSDPSLLPVCVLVVEVVVVVVVAVGEL